MRKSPVLSKSPVPPVTTYRELLSAIRNVQAQSKKRVKRVLNREKVREAWEAGRLIDAHVLGLKDRADYGKQVVKRLAKDLGTSDTELGLCLQFFRAYPIYPHAGKLTWSEYRDILSLNDSGMRKEVEDRAARGNWNREELRQEIRRRQQRTSVKTESLEPVAPGKIYTYRVVKASAGPYAGRLALDLGFSNYCQPKGLSRFREGDRVVLTGGGKLKKSASGAEDLFTFNAYVTQVIDGDTFHAVVDLGFTFVTEQKLRLAGLDAPIVESTNGREAKEFLETKLLTSGGRVLIKTMKSDKYDRYLADIWVPATNTSAGRNGVWINQQLIEQGLAVRAGE